MDERLVQPEWGRSPIPYLQVLGNTPSEYLFDENDNGFWDTGLLQREASTREGLATMISPLTLEAIGPRSLSGF